MKKYNTFRFTRWSELTWQHIYGILCCIIMLFVFTQYVVRDYEELAEKIDQFEDIEETMVGGNYENMVE